MTDAKKNGKKFLGPQDVKRTRESRTDLFHEFELPGYDGTFRIKRVGWREKEEVDLAVLVPGPPDPKTGQVVYGRNQRMYMPRILAIGWVDGEGNRYLPTMGAAEELAAEDPTFVMAMYQEISKFNGFSEEDREAVGKNLNTTPTPSGGSTSA